MNAALKVVIFSLLLGCAPLLAQEKPLERTLVPGDVRRYRVALTIRVEADGQSTERIGAKTYVAPVTSQAQATLTWQAARTIVKRNDDGSAEVEEYLDNFSEVRGQGDGPDSERLITSLRMAFIKWREEQKLKYREATDGQLRGVSPLAAPLLDESAPQLLTPWMIRALRPAAALPAQPLKFGVGWQSPREVQLPDWSDVRGTESGEWLAAPEVREPAARLHVVQQISGKVTGGKRPPGATGEGRFFGESLALVSLSDGRLLSATRSSTREVTWTLASVQGLPDPPRFRSRLSAEIQIVEIE